MVDWGERGLLSQIGGYWREGWGRIVGILVKGSWLRTKEEKLEEYQ